MNDNVKDNDFQWGDVEEDIIVRTTGAIAVYTNPHGNVVIRQQSTDAYQDEDTFVVVPRDVLPKLIRKLADLQEERSE